MDDPSFLLSFAEKWPTFAWVVPVVLIGFWVLRFAACANEPLRKALGGLGRYWEQSAECKQKRNAGEWRALREEVSALSSRVDDLQRRDEVYWAYVMYDEEWHRKYDMELLAAAKIQIRHLTFLEFREKWSTNRNFTKDDQQW